MYKINLIHNFHKFLKNPVKRIEYRKDITVLRSVAVCSVLLYHAEFKFLNGGWLGVDIFFVISGYLISNIIFSELENNSFSFVEFYKRRIKRILPAVMSTLLITIPFSYFLLVPKELLEYSRSLISSLFFYSNYYFRNLDFYNSAPAKKMPLLHMWTLSVEEQFYIIFPLVAFFIYKFFKKGYRIPISLFLLLSLFLNSINQTNDKFYFLQFRAWEFLLGVMIMFLGVTFKTKYIKNISVIFIIFSLYYFQDSDINQIEPKLFVLLGTTIYLLFDSHGVYEQVINNKIINYIGLSSFSIYLIHQPLFSFFRIYRERTFESLNNLDVYLLIFLSIILGFLSWKYIELYFINNKKVTNSIVLSFITIFISSIFYLGSESSLGFKDRYSFIPEEVIFYSLNTNFYPNNDSLNLNNWKNFKCTDGTCNFFNDGLQNTIYIFGDSHANILSVSVLRNLDELSQKYNISIKNGVGGRCLLTGQVDSVEYVGACERSYFEDFIKRINKDDIVVITGRFDLWLNDEIGKEQLQCKECNYENEISQRIIKLANVSKHLIIFYPHPTYDFPIAKSYLYKQSEWGKPIVLDYDEWNQYIKSTKIFLNNLSSENILRIETENYFCDKYKKGFCYASTDNEIFYTDDNHLSFEGVAFLVEDLKNIIVKINN